jgi:hypothetical protein
VNGCGASVCDAITEIHHLYAYIVTLIKQQMQAQTQTKQHTQTETQLQLQLQQQTRTATATPTLACEPLLILLLRSWNIGWSRNDHTFINRYNTQQQHVHSIRHT